MTLAHAAIVVVPAAGHLFNESLVCECGQTWRAHQTDQRPCPSTTEARKARMQRHEAGGRR